MRFSIVTPTLSRLSLIQACNSVEKQAPTDWEHHILFDGIYPETFFLMKELEHPQRIYTVFHKRADGYGNRARAYGAKVATGDVILYLDDDDHYINGGLAVLETLLQGKTFEWGVFPVLMDGSLFFHAESGCGWTTAGQIFHRRDIAGERRFYPDTPHYEADGHFVEILKGLAERLLVEAPQPLMDHSQQKFGVR